MRVLLNTSFFFAPVLASNVRRDLSAHWIPACASCGAAAPTCLRMQAEEGIERLAVQTPFASAADAERFRAEVLEPLADMMTRRYGAEAFTCFSTLMEIIEL